MMTLPETKHILLALIILTAGFAHQAFAQMPPPLTTAAKQAIIIDDATGMTLFAKNADERMPTSSMSKVITIYAVFDALKNGTLKLDDTFRVSEEAWQKGGSKMFVEVNKDVAIEDLIRGVVIQSGNDATIVLAEGLAGSENAFAAQLNSIAQNLGMANSHFANASGWPDDNHYSTARDLGTLASAIIKNFPDYYHYYAEKEFTYNGIRQMNRNPLLLQNIGADGVKTGHTESGGFGLIGSGIAKDGRRVIIVLNGLDSLKARAQESKKLLLWGMENFENKHVFDAGATITTAPVIYGQQKQIALAVQSPLDITIPKNSAEKVKIKTDYQSPIIAPVKKGDTIGTLTVSIPGQPDVTTPLIAAEDIEEQGIFGKTVSKLKHLISGA